MIVFDHCQQPKVLHIAMNWDFICMWPGLKILNGFIQRYIFTSLCNYTCSQKKFSLFSLTSFIKSSLLDIPTEIGELIKMIKVFPSEIVVLIADQEVKLLLPFIYTYMKV